MTDAHVTLPLEEAPKDDPDVDYRPSIWCGLVTLVFINGWIVFVHFIAAVLNEDGRDGEVFAIFMGFFFLFGFVGGFLACIDGFSSYPRRRLVPFPGGVALFVLLCWVAYHFTLLVVVASTCGTQVALEKLPVHQNVTAVDGVVSFPPTQVNADIFGLTFSKGNDPTYVLFMSPSVLLTTTSLSVPVASDGMTWGRPVPLDEVLYRAINDLRIRWPASNVTVPVVLRFFDYLSEMHSAKGHCGRSSLAFWIGFALWNPLFIFVYIYSVK